MRTLFLSFWFSTSLLALTSTEVQTLIDERDALRQALEAYAADSPVIIQGRLTLTSGTAITTSNVTGSTTVYFTPHDGNKIALYSGTAWQLFSFSEVSVAVPATTTKPFDIFAYNNSGTVALEATDWTDDTNRATALTKQDGVWVKSGATTRRYLGTARTTGVSGQTEDSLTKRFLWNYYNRIPRALQVVEATGSWSYSSGVWRAANNNSANRVELVVGVALSPLELTLHTTAHTLSAKNMAFCIGEDVTNACHASCLGRYNGYNTSGAVDFYISSASTLRIYPAVGYHYYAWLEISQSGGSCTIYGTGGVGYVAPGMHGWIDG